MSTTTTTPAPAVALPASASPQRSLRWALACADGRRLLRHPLFLVGMAGAAFAFAVTGGGESISALGGDVYTFFGAGPATFLVACLAANREHRDRAQDLYAAAPMSQRVRSEAALLSIAWPALASAALTGTAALALAGPDGVVAFDGHRYALRPLELVQGPLYIAFAGTLGVMVGRWTKRAYPGAIGALVLFLPPVAWLPWFVFGDGVPQGYSSDWLDNTSVGWHVIGLAGLVTLAVAGARARHDRRARVALLALAGLAAAIAGIALSAPPGY